VTHGLLLLLLHLGHPASLQGHHQLPLLLVLPPLLLLVPLHLHSIERSNSTISLVRRPANNYGVHANKTHSRTPYTILQVNKLQIGKSVSNMRLKPHTSAQPQLEDATHANTPTC
jgi:hypothetical protein